MTPRATAAASAILALAALSLALPFAPVYDPFGWLIWGREIIDLDLDTAAGPSWKPLPVLFTTLFAPTGDAAPALWLFVARCGWLAAPVLAGVLAARLVPRLSAGERWAAGALAAAGVVLLDDPFTSWTRQFAGGLAEPLLVALVLGAVERGLAGRLAQAWVLGVGAALLRPEAWPLLAVFAIWLWRRDAADRRAIAGGAALIAVLWAVPDLAGSGSPLTGAERARDPGDVSVAEGIESLGRSFGLVVAGLWAGAALAVVRGWRERDRWVGLIAALALVWIAVVAAMATVGFAGLPRFAAPAAALVCVLGAAATVRLAAEVRGAAWLGAKLESYRLGALITRGRRRQVIAAGSLVVAIGVAIAVQSLIRVTEVPGEVRRATAYAREVDDLEPLVDEIGRRRLLSLGQLATADLFTQTALAWTVRAPVSEVGVRVRSAPRPGVLLVPGEPSPALATTVEGGERVAANRTWTAYAFGSR